MRKDSIQKLSNVLSILMVMAMFSCNKENQNIPANQNVTFKNVSYGSHTRQVYDIYLPKGRDTNSPVILMIHGGAWKAGQKEDMNSFKDLIRNKWPEAVVVNMNYRLASNTFQIHHNQMMDDIQLVVDHLKTNRSKYQISNKMGLVGASAGGQLAMIYAYKYNNQMACVGNIFGPSIINDWTWYNSNNPWLGGYVGDILSEYVGQTWDTTAYKSVSPYWNINANSAPTIIFHGNLDPIVPVYQSQWLHGKLKNLGVSNQYHEYIAFHSLDATQSADAITKLVQFFKGYL